jgi:hypothetical protein
MTPALRGQKLTIRADEWNRVRQAASLVTGSVAGRTDASTTQAEIVLVKNSTGSAFARFAPVGISTRLSVSIESPPALTGVAVSSTSAVSYGVCQEPIPAGGIGRVAVGGVFLARIATVSSVGPTEAGVASGTATHLTATGDLWKVAPLHTNPVSPDPQTSPPSNTGVFWVRPLGGGSSTLGTLFAVVLVQDGGANGTASAAPTFTYTINDINDEVELEGTPQAPELGRPNGAVTAATRGMAYYDVDGDITLFYAHEVPTTDTCA